jgi:hypothetical protein
MFQKSLISLAILCLSLSDFVTAQCTDRYLEDVFSAVSETEDILYGSAETFSGSMQDLFFDFYEPVGDTASTRPLIILAHGGFFLAGSRDDGDIDDLCRAYAAKGYACASMSYRLGWSGFIPDSIDLGEALIRGVQDAKAMVRFFRQDAAGPNTYRIDPNQIFMGGSSAGGFIGVHMAFLDDLSLLPTWASDLITDLGGVEGNSGNPGWPSNIQAGISYAGAIVDTTWMTNTGAGIVSTHSFDDEVVPFGTGTVFFLFFPVFQVQGAAVFDIKAENLGVDHAFLPFLDAGHVPHVDGPAAFDTTVSFTTAFLYQQLGCNTCEAPSALTSNVLSSNSVQVSWTGPADAQGYQIEGGPLGAGTASINLLTNSRTVGGLAAGTDYQWRTRTWCNPELSEWTDFEFFSTPLIREENPAAPQVYPNPALGASTFQNQESGWLRIYNMQGQLVLEEYLDASQNSFQIDLDAGIYQLWFQGENLDHHEKFIRLN